MGRRERREVEQAKRSGIRFLIYVGIPRVGRRVRTKEEEEGELEERAFSVCRLLVEGMR